ncbi:MAG: rhomboid family intramembrane serine protease [Candidatus Pacearchaeota archaeon]
MVKWFNNKFDREIEREKLIKYTKRNLRKNSFDEFFRKLSITNWLIIFNIIVFILVLIFSYIFSENKINSLFALQANNFFSGYVWTPLTSMFMHANIIHLFVNMFSLFFLGNFVERIIGRKRFFAFYIISGLFAGLFFVFLSFFLGGDGINCNITFFGGCLESKIFVARTVSAVGASGAIFAIAGLLALLTPRNKVYLIAGPLIAIIIQAIFVGIFNKNPFLNILDIFINLYIIFSIFALFSFNPRIRRLSLPIQMPFWILPLVAIVPLFIIGLFVDLPIGNTAHLGGIISGLFYALYLKNKYRMKTELISRIFSR